MKRFLFPFLFWGIFISFAHAQDDGVVKSVTLQGGPIATKHIQGGTEHYRERHGLAVLKVHTEKYGNWGLYFLNPNSVENTSFGAGYVTDPYSVYWGPLDFEFSGALGLVSGYQDYPVPLLVGEARLVLYDEGSWNAGLSMAANPYVMEDDITGENNFGVVVTSPFLSVRYRFD